MTSPVSAIEAIEKAMRDHIKVDATGLSPAVASAYVVGFDEAAKAVSVIVTRKAEALTGIGSAHDLISDWLGEGTDDLPDETPVRIEIGKRTIIAENLGSLRRARALLGGENAE